MNTGANAENIRSTEALEKGQEIEKGKGKVGKTRPVGKYL